VPPIAGEQFICLHVARFQYFNDIILKNGIPENLSRSKKSLFQAFLHGDGRSSKAIAKRTWINQRVKNRSRATINWQLTNHWDCIKLLIELILLTKMAKAESSSVNKSKWCNNSKICEVISMMNICRKKITIALLVTGFMVSQSSLVMGSEKTMEAAAALMKSANIYGNLEWIMIGALLAGVVAVPICIVGTMALFDNPNTSSGTKIVGSILLAPAMLYMSVLEKWPNLMKTLAISLLAGTLYCFIKEKQTLGKISQLPINHP
jgi:hypothetical protein